MAAENNHFRIKGFGPQPGARKVCDSLVAKSWIRQLFAIFSRTLSYFILNRLAIHLIFLYTITAAEGLFLITISNPLSASSSPATCLGLFSSISVMVYFALRSSPQSL